MKKFIHLNFILLCVSLFSQDLTNDPLVNYDPSESDYHKSVGGIEYEKIQTHASYDFMPKINKNPDVSLKSKNHFQKPTQTNIKRTIDLDIVSEMSVNSGPVYIQDSNFEYYLEEQLYYHLSGDYTVKINSTDDILLNVWVEYYENGVMQRIDIEYDPNGADEQTYMISIPNSAQWVDWNYASLNDLLNFSIEITNPEQVVVYNNSNFWTSASGIQLSSNIDHFDKIDNFISGAFLSYITSININRRAISSLLGIQNMPNLENINASDNLLSSVDLSYNTKLTSINFEYNGLSSIDISNNLDLSSVNLNFNNIQTIDLSTNNAVSFLSLISNDLTSIDVSNLTDLVNLHLENNNIASIDLSANMNLHGLFLTSNNLTNIDLFSNTSLTRLNLADNNISSIDLSQNVNLTNVLLGNNSLSSLDLSNNPNVYEVDFSQNDLTSFANFSTNLQGINASSNQNLSSIFLNNTARINNIIISDTPNLTCISIDYSDFFSSKFSEIVDSGVSFSESCGNTNQGLVPILDDNFENKLISLGYDDTLDGFVAKTNISSIVTLDLSNSSDTPSYQKILSLSGIEYFTSLKNLYLDHNLLDDVNLRSNTLLEKLSVANNRLEFLDLSQNNNLFFLATNDNELSLIDLKNTSENFNFFDATNNNSLTCVIVDDISYYNTNFSEFIDSNTAFTLDCSSRGTYISNPKLEKALIQGGYDNVYDNHIISPEQYTYVQIGDISYVTDINSIDGLFEVFTEMIHLNIMQTTLEDLEILNNTNLQSIALNNNVLLDNLTLTNLSNLTEISGSSNKTQTLTVSQNPSLTRIDYRNSNVSNVNLSELENLTDLWLSANQIQNLNVGSLVNLVNLVVDSNALSSLDVSNNVNLDFLNISFNNFSQINISNNTLLTRFWCSGNQISQIDLSNNTQLDYFSAYNNAFSNLDFSNNTVLTILNIWDNSQLTSLNLTNNTELNYLSCGKIGLSTLDLSNNTKLQTLYIRYNETNHSPLLTSLDLSNNLSLQTLYLNYISIPSLDLTANTALVSFQAYYSELEEVLFGQNDNLNYVNIRMSKMKSLDLSGNPNVQTIYMMNNQLNYLNVANGNNKNFAAFNATNNPNLSCIQVDDKYWSDGQYNWPLGVLIRANWYNSDGPFNKFEFDSNSEFSEYCEPSLSIDSSLSSRNLIYPNPTHSKIFLNYSKFNNAKLYNIGGKLLRSSINPSIDLKGLPSQMYILKVYDESSNEIGSHKIIKK